jgi:hypothetical protein
MLTLSLVQCDEQNDARNQDKERDKKMAIREHGFRSLGKSQSNLHRRICFGLPKVAAKASIAVSAILGRRRAKIGGKMGSIRALPGWR